MELSVGQMLGMVGWANVEQAAAKVVALETQIANAHWTRAESRNRDKTYNPVTPAELAAMALDRSAMFVSELPIHPLDTCSTLTATTLDLVPLKPSSTTLRSFWKLPDARSDDEAGARGRRVSDAWNVETLIARALSTWHGLTPPFVRVENS